MKQIYASPSLKILICGEQEIILTSNEFELPIIPGNPDIELPVVPGSMG